MVKKMLVLGVTLVMLFLFTACGYPTEKFNSLAEMQAVMAKDVYYFDFKQEGIKEAGKYETSIKATLDDGSYHYLRYSVWYDVEYEIDGQKQERKLRVVATEYTQKLPSFGYKSTEAFRSVLNQIFGSWLDKTGIAAWTALIFDENKKAVLFSVNIYDNYYYYFNLEGVAASMVEEDVEIFLSICEFAITNRYQIS